MSYKWYTSDQESKKKGEGEWAETKGGRRNREGDGDPSPLFLSLSLSCIHLSSEFRTNIKISSWKENSTYVCIMMVTKCPFSVASNEKQ